MPTDDRARVTATVRGSRRPLLPALGTWAFFLTFSGQGVRDLVGWWTFGVIAALSGVVLLLVFLYEGHRVPWRALPPVTTAYVVVCVLSIIWSQYRRETALAALLMLATSAAGVLLACGLSLRQLTDALSRSLEATLVLSLLLEAWVALVLHHPLIPLYMRDWDEVPISYYWVNGDLFNGGPIQGIVGNRNPLAFIALLTLLCVAVRWADRRVRPLGLVTWTAVSLLVLVLAGSATVSVALIVCAAVCLLLWLVRHAPPRLRPAILMSAAALGVALVAAAVGLHSQVTAALGRSTDLSGRWEIWQRVLDLWEKHTILGWGWIMYWVPWLPLFATLVVRPDGTPTMSAHNAYIEALFQTGVVGATLVVVLVVLLLYRSFRLALRYVDSDASVLLPALLMTAMTVQSFTESRLLSEGNWVLVCALGTWLGLHRLYERNRGDGEADGRGSSARQSHRTLSRRRRRAADRASCVGPGSGPAPGRPSR
ncbi:O-antigen ligase family protein [Actinomyces glycerinitolerans]|uniref:O-antigen ligase n=1 Tax=Actinomyces glycerinitolerans TaxID=1892869 RepID=A0A1M4S2U0_9ACTO|nr:O-antigen ligase family protein [Actinomyces glycerinitolerans]SHE26544.1 o-antigen ligase [Actinomyces glycerinitolerans]